jgi:anaerobic ribonucleoside-triphosphate reductase
MKKQIPCEVYSRVVGYFRPIDRWNSGKRSEFHERITFAPLTKQELDNAS